MVVVLLALFVLGVLLGISSDSWFGMWVGIELSSIAVYPWVIDGNSEASCSVLFKYLVLQTVSSSMVYLGLVIIKGSLGISLGVVVALVGLQLKFGGLFIGWMIGVVEVISWRGLALVLGVQKIPVFVVLLNVCLSIKENMVVWTGVTLAIGSCLGCVMMSIRSFILSSSVLNIGWIWCGLGLEVGSSFNYFTVYMLSFVVLCSLLASDENSSCASWSVWSFGGLSVLEVILVGSVSGIPPFAVFMCNVELIQALVGDNFVWECWVLVLLSVFLMYVYIQLMLAFCLHTAIWEVEKGLNNAGLVRSGVTSLILTYCVWSVV